MSDPEVTAISDLHSLHSELEFKLSGNQHVLGSPEFDEDAATVNFTVTTPQGFGFDVTIAANGVGPE